MAVVIWLFYLAFAAVNAFALRHWLAPFQRLNDWNWQALVLIDIAIGFALFGALYVAGIYPGRPDPRETISSVVGRHLMLGKRWAVVAAKPIDWLFLVLTSQRGHCLKEAGKHTGAAYSAARHGITAPV